MRGKCRHCQAPIAPRYFIVELIAFAVWAGLWYRFLCLGWDPGTFLAYAAAGSALIAIILIDLELFIIPDQINAFLWMVGILYNAWLFVAKRPEAMTWGMPSALAGWLVGVGAIWGIALFGRVLFRKDAMGHGDIKMARGIGAVVFPGAALVSFGMAIAFGAILGVVQILFRRGERVVGGVPEDMRKPLGGDAVSGAASANAKENTEELEEDWEPEPIPMLLKSGVGYLLCIDIAGLFAPKLYERWFGESQFATEVEEDEFEVERTMIPFGPYLALGAIAVLLFQKELLGLVDAYVRWVSPPIGGMEQ